MVWDPEEQDRLEELEPIHYDVPRHMQRELWLWVCESIQPREPGRGRAAINAMEVLLNVLRVQDMPQARNGYSDVRAWFERYCQSPEGMLSTIRALLKHWPGARAGALEAILVRGHSGYAVRADGKGLEFRVPPAAREQVETAVADSAPKAGQLLTKAWNAAYDLTPRADDAWTAAFKAAEAVLRPIISPDDGNARLGKMIADYESSPSKWESCFEESRPTFDPSRHTELDGRETVIQMARTIAYGEKQRHAEGEDANSIEEARSAVHLAIAVVMLCNGGAIRRR